MKQFPKNLSKEFSIFKKLDTPAKVQDFLETLKFNFQDKRETCWSPREVIRQRKAHCMEGALLAAAIFWHHARPPLLLDLRARADDDDHVVALFKEGGRWGAVSKTNHSVLRYREPVFRDIRELAMSYFSEYFLHTGAKTLRAYSAAPFDLRQFGDAWLTAQDNLFAITDALDAAPHRNILSREQVRNLRKADPIERRAGKIVEWKQ